MPQTRVHGVLHAYDLLGQLGQAPPLVLIHGAQGDRSMFGRLAPVFAQHFTVLTFDQRGSGQSDKPDVEYSTAMLADDTAALMDHVGFSAAHVVGMSMGGMIAQELALRHSSKVRSLVLGCTTPGGRHAVQMSGGVFERAYSTEPISAEERGRALAESCFTTGYLERHPEIVPAMIEARRRRPVDPIGLARRMQALRTHDSYDRLPEITAPTLVITGKDDVVIAAENSRLLAERIAGARSVVLEPAGHVFWTEQADAALTAMLAFLQGQPL